MTRIGAEAGGPHGVGTLRRGGGVEPAALLVVLQRVGELVQLALEQLVEVVRGCA